MLRDCAPRRTQNGAVQFVLARIAIRHQPERASSLPATQPQRESSRNGRTMSAKLLIVYEDPRAATEENPDGQLSMTVEIPDDEEIPWLRIIEDTDTIRRRLEEETP